MLLQLRIDQIDTQAAQQVRAGQNQEAVGEWAGVLAGLQPGEPNPFPPIVVFREGKRYWLGDGFHRLLAHIEAGFRSITVEVREGGRREAVLFALSANGDARGVRLTREDKEKGRRILLADDEWQQWSDRLLAKTFPHLGADVTFAGTRRDLHPQVLADRKYVRNGKVEVQRVRGGKEEGEAEASVTPAASPQDAIRISAKTIGTLLDEARQKTDEARQHAEDIAWRRTLRGIERSLGSISLSQDALASDVARVLS